LLRRRIRQIRKAVALLQHPVFRQGLRHGVGASLEHKHQLSGLSLATVVDIGANVGQFTLLIRGLYPNARVFAFEPLERPAEVYRRLFKDDPLVRLYQDGIAPAANMGEMHVSRRDDCSSLLPISARQVDFAPGTEEVGRESVSLVTLTQRISPREIVSPALLKLDVQGFELEAMKGCEPLLHLFDFVYAEVSFLELYVGQALADEVIDWLLARDFRVSGINNPSYGREGRVVQADVFFRRTRALRPGSTAQSAMRADAEAGRTK
jgi:FkbM family methyltransferase